MAEIKNSFTSSRMNQDLDDRLVPSNEYREGRNISIISSENSNTGAIQNITGNELSAILYSGTGTPVEVIGHFVDQSANVIYTMVTNYTDPSFPNTNIDIHQALSSNTVSKIIKVDLNPVNVTVTELVSGVFLNFSTTHPITGINLLENLLFWTDNRNQPRKINVDTAFRNANYYSNEEKISVAKYAPIFPIEFAKKINNNLVGTMKDVVSQYLPNGYPNENPNYNEDYAGDPAYLSDKFVRFSYRFRFDDGEYSILAPFSQIAFIPEQDGSFMQGDEGAAYRSSVVEFMKNKVNEIELVIPFENPANNIKSLYNIKEIDIIYKESDSLVSYVLDTIPTESITNQDKYYYYNYQSRKPRNILINSQVLRVYDKTPVKALAQEVSGGRVIYSNYVDKHTPPKSLDYQVAVSSKGEDIATEYPLHTVKQNRNYQIGVVLCDKFGRQSDVILSPSINNNGTSNAGIFFVGSSFYAPYMPPGTNVFDFVGNSIKMLFESPIVSNRSPLNDLGIPATGEPGLYSTTNVTGWYSYKIVVKQNQQEYYNVYTPGALAGYPTGDNFPVGENSVTSHISLFSDNINKIPRDLSEVGPDQKQYRSSVKLFGRVQNNIISSVASNVQFFPTKEGFSVPTLGNASDLGITVANSSSTLYQINTNPIISRISTNETQFGVTFASGMKPFLAVLETNPVISNIDIYWETSSVGLISELNEAISIEYPGAYEFVNIDYLQFEDQNRGGSDPATGASNGPWVTDLFYPIKLDGNRLPLATITSLYVVDGQGTPISGRFEVVTTVDGLGQNQFRIKIIDNFYFNSNNSFNLFTFTLAVYDGISDTSSISFNGAIQNIPPSINTPTLNNIQSGMPVPYDICTFTGVNGSFGNVPASGTPIYTTTSDLLWSFNNNSNTITYGAGASAFSLTINPNSGLLQVTSGNPTTQENVIIQVKDSGQLTATYSLNLDFRPGDFAPLEFNTDFNL